jgi:diguanylate cyclase (GGDEF)-like protein
MLVRHFLAVIVAWLAFWLATPALASPEATGLFGKSCLLGSREAISFEQARSSTQWNCSPDFRDASQAYVWLEIDNDGFQPGGLFLAGMAAPIERLDVVIEARDGSLTERAYAPQDLVENWAPGNNYAVPFPLHGNDITKIYVGLSKPQSHMLVTSLSVEPAETIAKQRDWISALFAICIGMLLIVSILSGVMYAAVGYKVAAYHAVFSLLISIYVASASSLIFLVAPQIGLWGRSFVNYGMLSLAITMLCPIMLRYFERELMTVGLRRVIWIASVFSLSSAFALPIGYVFDFPARTLYHLLHMPGSIAVATVTITMIRRKSHSIRSFILAWAAPVAFGIERVLRGMDLYYLPQWLDYLLFVALAIQAVVMTVAIALQAEWIRRERDRARFLANKATDEAMHDALTGLPNRRDFDRTSWKCGDFLAIVDIDHFKRVNDTYGHDAGDCVLQAVGRALCESQSQGLVQRAWRLGGEEFALRIKAPSIEQAALAANRVRTAVGAEVQSSVADLDGTVTASAGLAIINDEWRQSYRAADAALYQAKAGGRDRLSYDSKIGETVTIFPAHRASVA